MKCRCTIAIIAEFLMCVLLVAPVCPAQQETVLSKDNQGLVSDILRKADDEVKKHYYDPKLHGLDLDARYTQYSERIGKAHDLGDGYRVVAAYLAGLKDSHTYFVPPSRANHFDYGYRYALVGDACFITHIRPGTDAESKLHVGDRIGNMNGYGVDRQDYPDVRYYFGTLAPQGSTKLALWSPAGGGREAVVNAINRPDKKVMDLTEGEDYYDLVRRSENEDHATHDRIIENGDVAIWKMQQFDLGIDGVEKGIGIARKHKALILDLRGDGGGAVRTLELMVGSLFDHDVKICDRVGRKDMKPMIAKHHGSPFQGKLIVLVDAGSASASELLARVVQLEHRGTVIGDKTAGAVMEAMDYQESLGADTQIFYLFSVTDANLIMTDGKSLENMGVAPDELLLPTGADLAAGRDPVLARAAELAGVKLDTVDAGKMFPFEWLPM